MPSKDSPGIALRHHVDGVPDIGIAQRVLGVIEAAPT
jgi:hypothetical protein